MGFLSSDLNERLDHASGHYFFANKVYCRVEINWGDSFLSLDKRLSIKRLDGNVNDLEAHCKHIDPIKPIYHTGHIKISHIPAHSPSQNANREGKFDRLVPSIHSKYLDSRSPA